MPVCEAHRFTPIKATQHARPHPLKVILAGFGYLQQHHGTFFFEANPSLGESYIFFTEGGDPTQVGLMSSAERVSFLQRFYENSPQKKIRPHCKTYIEK